MSKARALSEPVVPHGAGSARPPAFVLCAARSGSTLLRLILNGHPEVACPPETNLVEIFSAIGFAVSAAGEPDRAGRADPAWPDETTQLAAAICRTVADSIVGAYAEARGKAMWVDKSLASVFFAEYLAKIYPDSRFICLYRQCPDTVASLQEASSWSYNTFGILPHVQNSPGNLAQALTAYWVERVSLVQSFEKSHPDRALRVRYEDLVEQPGETAADIFGFLEVSSDEASVASALAFEPNVAASVPGDIKARFSRGIDTSSIGRGWRVPFDTVTPALREQVDELSAELGYAPLPQLKRYATEAATPLIAADRLAGPHSNEVTLLLEKHVAQSLVRTNGAAKTTTSSRLKLVLTDIPAPWMIDLDSGIVENRDGEAEWLALTDSATLLSLVSGKANPGIAVSNSTLQIVSASDKARPDDFLDRVDDLMTLLRG